MSFMRILLFKKNELHLIVKLDVQKGLAMSDIPFQWLSEYSIGYEKIDLQHQRLFKLANDVYQCVCDQGNAELVEFALTTLIDYTVEHFKDEEQLMKENQYPDIASHRAAHKHLIEQVRELQQAMQAGELILMEEFLVFLQDWLVEHILIEDRAVGKFITDQSSD